MPSLTRWFYTEVVEGADATLRENGHDSFLVDLAIGPGERAQLFTHTLLRKRADAVIALGIRFAEAELRELRALPMPVVIVGAPVSGLRSIGLDDVAASRPALSYLNGLGHRRIAHVGGADEFGLDRSVADLREQTWRSELQLHGLVAPRHWFASGGFLLPQSRAAAAEMLRVPDRPTAVFAGSDEMAFGLLLAAATMRRGGRSRSSPERSATHMIEVIPPVATKPPTTPRRTRPSRIVRPPRPSAVSRRVTGR